MPHGFVHRTFVPTRIASDVRVSSTVMLLLVLTGMLSLYSGPISADAALHDAGLAGVSVSGGGQFARLERIDEAELAELRGGLSVAGIEIDFGATLRTLIDTIELKTQYRISETGIDVLSQMLGRPSIDEAVQPVTDSAVVATTSASGRVSVPISVVTQPVAAPARSPSSPANETVSLAPRPVGGVSALPSTVATLVGPETGVSVAEIAPAGTVSPAPRPVGGVSAVPSTVATLVGPETGVSVAEIAPAGIDLSGVADYRGIVVDDVKGFTAAVHDLSRKAVISSLVSNASERKISQRLNIDVRLGNVKQIRASALRSAISRRIRQR